MSQSRQTFKNTTTDEIFITLEPWCWRYRLGPGDIFEVSYSLACAQESWIPLEVHVGAEGDKTGLFLFANSNGEPKVLLNGRTAVADYDLS